MNYRVILQPRTAEQLEQQYQHIASRNPRAAASWFNRFLSALDGLCHDPQRCAVAPESELIGREIRQFLVGRRGGTRRVFFFIEEQTGHVFAIRHSAQSGISLEELLD